MQDNTFATAASPFPPADAANDRAVSVSPVGSAKGRQFGPYTLLREAGRGAAATVYEALDERIGRTVAVKVLERSHATGAHPSAGESRDRDIARFQREARAVARLTHGNIVTVFDVGEQDDEHYIVMEFVDGVTLRERMDHGRLGVEEACRVVAQIASALDAIHAQNVVHRDLKPSNVMVTADGQAKLLDFGVARNADDSSLTVAGMLVGSPAYMSPEQIRGEPAAPAADLWALGVLAYEMLSGAPPFAGPNVPSVLYRISHEQPMTLSGLAAPLNGVLRRALDKDPARRFGTAAEFAYALMAAAKEVVSGPADASPPARAYVAPPTLAMPAAEASATAGRRRERPHRRAWAVAAGLVAAVGAAAGAVGAVPAGRAALARVVGPVLRRATPTAVPPVPGTPAPRAIRP